MSKNPFKKLTTYLDPGRDPLHGNKHDLTLLGLADLVERGAQALQVSLGDGVLMEGGS